MRNTNKTGHLSGLALGDAVTVLTAYKGKAKGYVADFQGPTIIIIARLSGKLEPYHMSRVHFDPTRERLPLDTQETTATTETPTGDLNYGQGGAQ